MWYIFNSINLTSKLVYKLFCNMNKVHNLGHRRNKWVWQLRTLIDLFSSRCLTSAKSKLINRQRPWRSYDVVGVMEGNLNQYMSLQGEHDSEERRSDRTPEESYMLEDNSLYGQEFAENETNKDWSKAQARRPSSLVQLAPETQNLCQAIQSLERTIGLHCQLLNRKTRSTSKTDPTRIPQGISAGTTVVRGDKVSDRKHPPPPTHTHTHTQYLHCSWHALGSRTR